MTKYTKLQIIKHALQYYVQRNAPLPEIEQEKRLLSEIEEEIQKLVTRFGIRVNTSKPIAPILIEWEKKQEELRKIVPSCADWIINEIKPESNQYTLPVAVGRISVFIQLALKGIDEAELLAAAQNYQEHLLLSAQYLSQSLCEIHLEG